MWDKRLFELNCPGKERYVGRAEWLRRILESAEVFGPRNVIPNSVASVEMAEPFGFWTVDEAIDSTAEGLQYFHVPRDHAPVHHLVPGADDAPGPDEPGGAPLEYHIRLREVYRATMEANGLSSPPGYGEPGADARSSR